MRGKAKQRVSLILVVTMVLGTALTGNTVFATGESSDEQDRIKINISKDSEQTVEQNVAQTIHVTAQGQCSQSVCLNVYLKNEDGSAATDIDAVNLLTSDQLTDKNTQKTIDETLKDSVTLNNGTKASPTAEWKNDKDDNGTVTSKYLQITMPADAIAINFDMQLQYRTDEASYTKKVLVEAKAFEEEQDITKAAKRADESKENEATVVWEGQAVSQSESEAADEDADGENALNAVAEENQYTVYFQQSKISDPNWDNATQIYSCYGYQFEETDYNPTYTNYKKYQQFMGSQSNDNDEFMWSANFVDTVDMKTLTGTSHNYETVSVPATCGRDAFTEERCSDCGLIKDGTRVEKENTAHEHHYIKFHEVYYTKTDGVKNEADNYVCPECGACITEPVKSKYEQANSTYEKRKAIWDAAIKNEAEGHTYVPTDAKWSDDYSTVTFQNLTCESCADKIDKLDCLLSSDDNATNKANRDSINKTLDKAVTVDAKMVSHAGTCDEGVTAVYKAADKTEDGVKYLVSTEVKGEAGQHTYSDVKFNWDAAAIKDDDGNITGYKTDQKEGTSVTVDEVKCSVCGEVQKNVSVSVVKDTDAYKAPTCEEAGKDVYVATVTSTDDNTVLAKETKEVAIAKLGHKYGDPVWSDWEEKDGKWTTTATFTCANDATHVQTPEVKIDSETVEKATYTKEGKVVYTASVTSPDGKKVVNPTTKEVVVEKERLAAVENLKASSSVGKVKLTWSEVKDAEGYLIYGIRGGGNKYGYIGMTSKTSFVDVKALTSDYNYYWVFAYCKDENGKMYPGLTAHYVYGKAQKCAAVTDLKASSVKGGVKLTWTKSAGAEGYLVYGIHPGEKYGYIGMTTKGTTFTDKKASSTDWNFYWVFPYHTDSNGNKVVGGTPKYVYGKAK